MPEPPEGGTTNACRKRLGIARWSWGLLLCRIRNIDFLHGHFMQDFARREECSWLCLRFVITQGTHVWVESKESTDINETGPIFNQ